MTDLTDIGRVAPHTVIGRWRIVNEIDCGGSSIVYLVIEIGGLGREAALKLRRKDTAQPLELFRNEIRFLREQPIPGEMPEWFDDGEYDGRPYVVMTLLEPFPRPLTAKRVKSLFPTLVRALGHLHEMRIVHGDLKLANYGLMYGRPVISDFATASYVNEGDKDVPIVYTPLYLAPEVVATHRLSYLTDIFAFGVSLEHACDKAEAGTFDTVHQMTVAALPERRCRDLDKIAHAIRWAGLKRLKVIGIIIALAGLGALGQTLYTGYLNRSERDKRFQTIAKQARNRSPCVGGEGKVLERKALKAHELKHLYKIVVELGPDDCFAKGLEYYTGTEDVPRNYDQAYVHFIRAYQIPGYTNATLLGKLAECYYWGRGCKRDRDLSLEFAKRATALGDKTGEVYVKILQIRSLSGH